MVCMRNLKCKIAKKKKIATSGKGLSPVPVNFKLRTFKCEITEKKKLKVKFVK